MNSLIVECLRFGYIVPVTWCASPDAPEQPISRGRIPVFDVFEQLDDDTYRARGGFSGAIAFKVDLFTPAGGGDAIVVEGRFEFERLSREGE